MKIHVNKKCLISNLTLMDHHASPKKTKKNRCWQFGTGALVSFDRCNVTVSIIVLPEVKL